MKMNKQISVTIPKPIFEASKAYCYRLGYRNLQEFIIDLMRRKVIFENIEKYNKIESRMKNGIGVKRFGVKSAVKYIRGL